MTNNIPNLLTNQQLSVLNKRKKVKSFFVPTINNQSNSLNKEHYTFHTACGGLYLNLGETNHRVLQLELSKPKAVNNAGQRTINVTMVKDNFGKTCEAECNLCKSVLAEDFVKNIAKQKVRTNICLEDFGTIQKKVTTNEEAAAAQTQKLTKAPIPPFAKTYLPPKIQKQVDEYKEANEKEEKKEEKKSVWAELWKDGIKPWVQLGLKVGGVFSAVWLMLSMFTGPLLGPLLLISLAFACFSNEIVDNAEKFVGYVRKQYKNAKKIASYCINSIKFSRDLKKDYWRVEKQPKTEKKQQNKALKMFKKRQEIRRYQEKYFQKSLKSSSKFGEVNMEM